jgi:hypothetical protein
MPVGTPPKGSVTSAVVGGLAGPLGVDVGEAVEVAGLDGGEGGLELLARRAVAGAEGVDERAGIAQPGLIGGGGHAAPYRSPGTE